MHDLRRKPTHVAALSLAFAFKLFKMLETSDLDLFETIAAASSGVDVEVAELRRRLRRSAGQVAVRFEWNKAVSCACRSRCRCVAVGGRSFPWAQLGAFGSGRFGGTIALDPGLHTYLFQVDGKSVHHPNRPWCHEADADRIVNWLHVNPPEMPLHQRPSYRAWRSAVSPGNEELCRWRGILGAIPQPARGVTFSVWAPTARQMHVVLNAAAGALSTEPQRISMRRRPFGVWSTTRERSA